MSGARSLDNSGDTTPPLATTTRIKKTTTRTTTRTTSYEEIVTTSTPPSTPHRSSACSETPQTAPPRPARSGLPSTPPPSPMPSASLQPSRYRMSRPSPVFPSWTPPRVRAVPPYPRPSTLRKPSSAPEAYYVITVGEEVGLFFKWSEVHDRIKSILAIAEAQTASGSAGRVVRPQWHKFATFTQAVEHYTRAHDLGQLDARPLPGGEFYPRTPSPSSPTPSSRGDNTSAEDLSSLMGSFAVS